MIILACTDENGGIMFNHRRQSRDIRLLNRISILTSGAAAALPKIFTKG